MGLDISLENLLINDVVVNIHPVRKSMHFVSDISVKFCDFGLAEIFDTKLNPQFLSNKFVGKTNYKSPEIYAKRPNFDARAADTWSLGVCLFSMLIGSMPFNKPSKNDPTFQWIMAGHILELIQKWKKMHYLNRQSLDILCKTFKTQKERITVKQLTKHCWFQAQQ